MKEFLVTTSVNNVVKANTEEEACEIVYNKLNGMSCFEKVYNPVAMDISDEDDEGIA